MIDETVFRFNGAGLGGESSILLDAFKRYEGIIGLATMTTNTSRSRARANLSVKAAITSCQVTVVSTDETLELDTDESYKLVLEAPTVMITAKTVFGALYGLETLSQLVSRGLEVNSTVITDHPRYQASEHLLPSLPHASHSSFPRGVLFNVA